MHFGRNILAILIITIVSLITTVTIHAHEEPCKTRHEKTHNEEDRNKYSALGLHIQNLWEIGIENGNPGSDSVLILTNYFNRNGSLSGQVIYDSSGPISISYIYDSTGTWLEELTCVNGIFDERDVFIYDTAGLIRHILSYDYPGSMSGRLEYNCNPDDNIISAIKYDSNDSPQYTIDYIYEPGTDYKNQIEVVQKSPDGTPILHVLNVYEKELRIKKSVFGKNEELIHSFAYKYTQSGEFAEIIKADENGKIIFKQKFEYSRTDLPESITETDSSGSIVSILHYSSDFWSEK